MRQAKFVALAGGLAGITTIYAQTTTFGPFTSTGQTPDSISVVLPANSSAVNFLASFSASVTFTPVVNNPVAGSEDFTVSFSSITLTLSSATGYFATDPLTLNLGPVSQTVSVSSPYAQTTVTIGPVSGQVSEALDTVFATAGSDTMTVTWTSLGGPLVTGGKGATINSDSESLSGSIIVVPEGGRFAAPALLALGGLAAWRARRRSSGNKA